MRSPVLVGVVGKALESVTLVLLLTLVPRLLGPADYGSFAVALSIVALGSAASSLGGPTWLSRFVPTAAAGDRPALARTLALRSARWRIGVCALAAVLATALAVVDPARFSPLACFFVLLALVFDVAATLVYQVGLALGKVARWSLRYPIQNTVLVAAVAVLHAGFGEEGALAGLALASGCVLVLGLVVVASPCAPRRGRRRCRPAPPVSRSSRSQRALRPILHRGGVVAWRFSPARRWRRDSRRSRSVALALT